MIQKHKKISMIVKLIELSNHRRKSDGSSRHFKGVMDGKNHFYQRVIKTKGSQDVIYIAAIKKRRDFRLKTNIVSKQNPFDPLERSNDTCQIEELLDGSQIYKEQKSLKKTIIIRTPLKDLRSPYHYVSTSLQGTPRNILFETKAKRIKNLVCQAIANLMRQSNYQLYSMENIFFLPQEQKEEQLKIELNTVSFVGMALIDFNKEIPEDQFTQIFELLGSTCLDKCPEFRYTIQLKMRALGMLIICLSEQRRINLLTRKNSKIREILDSNMSYLDKYKKCLKQSKKIFSQFLENKQTKEKLQKLETVQKTVKILQFLRKVFVEEKQMSWSQAINLLIPKDVVHSLPKFQHIQIHLAASFSYENFRNLHILSDHQLDKAQKLGLFEAQRQDSPESKNVRMYLTAILAAASDPEEVLCCQNIQWLFLAGHRKVLDLNKKWRIFNILVPLRKMFKIQEQAEDIINIEENEEEKTIRIQTESIDRIDQSEDIPDPSIPSRDVDMQVTPSQIQVYQYRRLPDQIINLEPEEEEGDPVISQLTEQNIDRIMFKPFQVIYSLEGARKFKSESWKYRATNLYHKAFR